MPIQDRNERRRRRLRAALAAGALAAILLVAAIWTAVQQQFGADSRIVTFVAAAAGTVGLLAAIAEVLGYWSGGEHRG